MDDARLLALLYPWSELLALPESNATVEFTNAQRVELGVELTLRVDVSAVVANVPEDLDDAEADSLPNAHELRQLREAIDALALVAHHKRHLLWEALAVTLDEDVASALRRGVALHLRVVLEAKKLRTLLLLKRRLGEFILVRLAQAPSRNAAFVALWEQLGSEMSPVAIVFDVSTVSNKDPGAIQHLVEFVQFVHTHRTPRHGGCLAATATELVSRALLCVENVVFTAHQLVLTRDAIDNIHGLLDVPEGFFQCRYVSCNAQALACYPEALTTFFNTLSRGAADGQITIDPHDVDPNGAMNVTASLCAMLIRSPAACERVGQVRLGGLLDACTQEDVRSVFFRTLVDAVFARASPISLSLGTKEVQPCDRALLNDAVQRWKRVSSHAEAKLRVVELCLEVPFWHHPFILAFLNALDEVQSIEMHGMNNVYGPPISQEMLATILAKFPSLLEVGLTCVGVDSMELFVGGPCPKLETIALCDLMLSRRDSLLPFIVELGDPSTRLAQTLHQFGIPNTGMLYGHTFKLDTVEAIALADALVTNTVLEYVHVCIENTHDHASENLRQRFQRFHGQRLPLHTRAQWPFAQEQTQLALLSCLQPLETKARSDLDGAIVHHILDFAAPWKKRVVKIDWDTPFHDMDDE